MTQTSSFVRSIWLCGMVLAVAVLASGCSGSSGPARYEVHGSVNYAGKPVPAGTVVFEPDPGKGNTGPASYASISAGQYRTEPGKGVVGGPHVVRITGADGIAHGELMQGRSLFSEYRTTIDLPKAATTHDFAIPGSHK